MGIERAFCLSPGPSPRGGGGNGLNLLPEVACWPGVNPSRNAWRHVVAVAYQYQAVYVKFIGTHEEYDALIAETVEMEP